MFDCSQNSHLRRWINMNHLGLFQEARCRFFPKAVLPPWPGLAGASATLFHGWMLPTTSSSRPASSSRRSGKGFRSCNFGGRRENPSKRSSPYRRLEPSPLCLNHLFLNVCFWKNSFAERILYFDSQNGVVVIFAKYSLDPTNEILKPTEGVLKGASESKQV